MVVSQDLASQGLGPPMGPVDLLSEILFAVLGPEDHAVRQLAFVAPPRIFAAATAFLALATIRPMIQGLPAMFGLTLASGQMQIRPSTAYRHVCTSCRL